MHILVMGSSGSGKTYLSTALKKRGVNATDADTVEGLGAWTSLTGRTVSFPLDANRSFLKNHAYLWDRQVLVKFLDRQQQVYLFGTSSNVFDMLDLFDKVFFLTVPPDLLVERLRDPSRDNPLGRTDYQVEYSLVRAQKHEEIARKLQIAMLDGTESPEQTFAKIRAQILE
jgi:adenylate kinase family enzyme